MESIYYLLKEGQHLLPLERAWEDIMSKYNILSNNPNLIISLKKNIFEIHPYHSNQHIGSVTQKEEGEDIKFSKQGLWEITTKHRVFHIHEKGLIDEPY